jgi:hypothetical protein
MEKAEIEKTSENSGTGLGYDSILLGFLVLLVAVAAFNQYQIASLSTIVVSTKAAVAASAVTSSAPTSTSASLSTPSNASSQSSVIPTGVPDVYGSELGIKYDDVSASDAYLADKTIAILSAYDRQITLQGDDLERYIDIASDISCEYCCGAESIIFSNGQAACGCAHSYAMRGLAKYLIQNHGTEFTDEEILSELGKWKVLFFPGIHEQKALVLQQKGIELNYINLASNAYRGIEQGASGGSMVGGC